MEILNLYSGIGGNRALWPDCNNITAVDNDPAITEVYQKLYPNDTVITGDAYQYLENNFKNFEFIWVSPPCYTHGQYRYNVGVIGKGYKPVMPDMTLYSCIIFLQTYFKGKYVIENVKPYYQALIKPSFELQRHLFWANFDVPKKKFQKSGIRNKNKISDFAGYEIVKNSKIKNKRQVLRNCVLPELGLYILETAINSI